MNRIRITNQCNMNCVFCETPARRDSVITRNAVVQDMLWLRKESDSLVFTGGEPTLNPQLPALARAAEGMGFRHISLETNGLRLSYREFADKLLKSPIHEYRITMVSHEAAVSDGITGLRGSLDLTLRGINNIADKGPDIVIRVPLMPATAQDLPDHIAFIARVLPAINHVELQLVSSSLVVGAVEPMCGIEKALHSAAARAQSAGVALVFAPGRSPAPCLLESPGSLHALFSFPPLTGPRPRGFASIPQCRECFLEHYCAGIPEALSPDGLRPPGPDFARKVLGQWPSRERETQRSVGNETAFVVTPSSLPGHSDRYIEEALIRINYNCNQRCLFCWIEPGYQNQSHAQVMESIEHLDGYHVGTVCITGGEPTLNPRMAEYIAALKQRDVGKICLQTNAVNLHQPSRVQELAEAGLDFAFVSLHSHEASLSDMMTGVEGSYEKTVQGILNIRASGILALVSHVMNKFNYRALPDFAAFVRDHLGGAPVVFLSAAPIYGAMMHRGLIPELSRLKKPLLQALELCYRDRIPFSGLAGMCGIPLCVLDGDPRWFPDMRRTPRSISTRDMIKTQECESCSIEPCCYGLRKHYADFFGTGELKAVNRPGFKPRDVDVWNGDYLKEFYAAW